MKAIASIAGLAVMALSVAACAPDQSMDKQPFAHCQAAPEPQCVIDAAAAALRRVPNDHEWVAAAVELATAMRATDRSDDALRLLHEAHGRAVGSGSAVDKAKSLAAVVNGFAASGDAEAVHGVIASGAEWLAHIEEENTHWDLTGKFAAAHAAISDADRALTIALEMPSSTYTLAAHKARTLNEIAVHQADNGLPDAALETIDDIDMGLVYYQSTVRSKVAALLSAERGDDIARLLAEAERIAHRQDDGYFVAGGLRMIGTFHAQQGNPNRALELFNAAAEHARHAGTRQEQARATSRVATALADGKQYRRANELANVAKGIADSEADDLLRYWAYYEVVGSAAFAGGFNLAAESLAAIPIEARMGNKSLRLAAQRDYIWGLARHGKLIEAFRLAGEMPSSREKVQALARMVRVMVDPEMPALPRYL